MDAELFIHGPRHAFYGLQSEAAYCTLFDDSSIKDGVRFIVEIRKSDDNKWYTYYNYCRYGNVLDVGGRSGAYLGVTLRLDAYYSNLRMVYTVLDCLFHKGAIGLIVKQIPTGYQYLVGDFGNIKSTIIEKLENPLGAILSNVLSAAEISPIDSSFHPGGKAIVKGIDDTLSADQRLADVRATGKIIFSSSIPIEQLQVVIDQCEQDKRVYAASKKQEIDRLEANVSSATKELSATSAKLSISSSEVKSLSSEVSRLKGELLAFEEERKKIFSLKDEINNLNNQLRTRDSVINNQNSQINSMKRDLEKVESLKAALNLANIDKTTLKQSKDDLQKEFNKLKETYDRLLKATQSEDTYGENKPKENGVATKGGMCDKINALLKSEAYLAFKHKLLDSIKKYRLSILVSLIIAVLLVAVGTYFYIHRKVPQPQEVPTYNASPKFKKKLQSDVILPVVWDYTLFPDSSRSEDYIVIKQKEFIAGGLVTATMPNDKAVVNATWRVSSIYSIDSLNVNSSHCMSFKPTKAGDYVISYVRNDTIIVQRKINVL